MGFAAVQRVGKGVNAASLSISSGDGWAAPTSGNLLVVTANSDATVTITGTWTAGPSVVDGNGAYMWWKISDGTETTITLTPSVSDTITGTACEYSGNAASPLDASNSSTIAASSGTTTTATSVTTTASGDLIVVAALLHAPGASAPTSPTWTNSFTNQLSASTGGTSAADTYTFYGELIAGAASSYSSSASWTNAISDRQQIMMAFTAAATAALIPPLPPRTVQGRDPGETWWIQRDRRDANTVATPANPLPSPLDTAWQAGANYWHLYAAATDQAQAARVWQPQQRLRVSDPNLLTTAQLENELLGSYDNLARHRSNPATHADRRFVPQQRPYVSDPLLLTTALLENELLGSVDDLARHRSAAAYVDRRLVPRQRAYVSDTNLLSTALLENELLGSADDLARHRHAAAYTDRRLVPQQRAYVSDPQLLATAELENELLGGAETPKRYNTPATHVPRWWTPQQPLRQTFYFDAGPDVPPLTLAWGAGGHYSLLYNQAGWQPDRREVPQQRLYISDPSFYPTQAPTDPLTVAWGVGGVYWHLYNTAADQVDRRLVPQQRRYISDPSMLATALLENELLGSADDLRRRVLTAAYWDRRQVPQQRVYFDLTLLTTALLENELLGSADDLRRRYMAAAEFVDRRQVPQQRQYYDVTLLSTAQLENELLGGAGTWARYNVPATHVDRREYPTQRLYVSDPLLLATALLEGVLLGGADDRARHGAWFTDRRLVPFQPGRYDPSLLTPPVPADPLLLAGGVGGDAWRRVNAAAFWDRRVVPWQPPRGTVLFFPAVLRDLVLTVTGPVLKWALSLLPARWQVTGPQSRWVVGPIATSLSTVSLEYVRVPVSASVAGQPVNPTTDPVQMAFVAPGVTPGPSDWQTASWDTATPNNTYTAQCLVGPGGTITLAAGDYTVWLKVTDSPEIPAKPAGLLHVF